MQTSVVIRTLDISGGNSTGKCLVHSVDKLCLIRADKNTAVPSYNFFQVRNISIWFYITFSEFPFFRIGPPEMNPDPVAS